MRPLCGSVHNAGGNRTPGDRRMKGQRHRMALHGRAPKERPCCGYDHGPRMQCSHYRPACTNKPSHQRTASWMPHPNSVSREAIVCRAAALDVDHKYDEDARDQPPRWDELCLAVAAKPTQAIQSSLGTSPCQPYQPLVQTINTRRFPRNPHNLQAVSSVRPVPRQRLLLLPIRPTVPLLHHPLA